MLIRILREKVNTSIGWANLYEYDPNLPIGSWVVWWYGRLIKKFPDKTGPLVMVTLRRVHGDLLTEELQACQIAISRLRFYSQGLILEDQLPVAKIALADAPVQGTFSQLLRLATGKKQPEAVIFGRFSISTMAAFL